MVKKTVNFKFTLGDILIDNFHSEITGFIEYHYENYGEDRDGNRGERMLFIDDVIFDLFDGRNLDEFITHDQYLYLVDRAKESCYFE